MPKSPLKLVLTLPSSDDNDTLPAARVHTSPGVLPIGFPNTLIQLESTGCDPLMVMPLDVNVGKLTGSDRLPMVKLPLPSNPDCVSVSEAPRVLVKPPIFSPRVLMKLSDHGVTDGDRLKVPELLTLPLKVNPPL